MKTIFKYWYLFVLLLSALLINENVVRWALAVKVGGHSITAGFADAFEYFNITGYLFFTTFRIMPYVGLGITLIVLSRTNYKDYLLPVFIGGLIGILTIILYGSWMAQRPYYTDEHVSSTTGISFLFIPIFACSSGLFGVFVLATIYTPFRLLGMKRKQNRVPPEPTQ